MLRKHIIAKIFTKQHWEMHADKNSKLPSCNEQTEFTTHIVLDLKDHITMQSQE